MVWWVCLLGPAWVCLVRSPSIYCVSMVDGYGGDGFGGDGFDECGCVCVCGWVCDWCDGSGGGLRWWWMLIMVELGVVVAVVCWCGFVVVAVAVVGRGQWAWWWLGGVGFVWFFFLMGLRLVCGWIFAGFVVGLVSWWLLCGGDWVSVWRWSSWEGGYCVEVWLREWQKIERSDR